MGFLSDLFGGDETTSTNTSSSVQQDKRVTGGDNSFNVATDGDVSYVNRSVTNTTNVSSDQGAIDAGMKIGLAALESNKTVSTKSIAAIQADAALSHATASNMFSGALKNNKDTYDLAFKGIENATGKAITGVTEAYSVARAGDQTIVTKVGMGVVVVVGLAVAAKIFGK